MSKMVDRGVYRDEIGAVTQEKDEKKEISRRRFLTNVAASGAALAIVPRRVLGRGFTTERHAEHRRHWRRRHGPQ